MANLPHWEVGHSYLCRDRESVFDLPVIDFAGIDGMDRVGDAGRHAARLGVDLQAGGTLACCAARAVNRAAIGIQCAFMRTP